MLKSVTRLGGVRSQVQVLSSRLNNSKASKKLGAFVVKLGDQRVRNKIM